MIRIMREATSNIESSNERRQVGIYGVSKQNIAVSDARLTAWLTKI